jgi:hypothetical protein
MASGREAVNFHVVRVGNVRGAVGSDCNVVQKAPAVGRGYLSLSDPVCRSKAFRVEGGC